MKRNFRSHYFPVPALAFVALLFQAACSNSNTERPAPNPGGDSRIHMPAGFKITTFAGVPGARSLARSPSGIIFVGTRGDKIYAVTDTNGDFIADHVYQIAQGLFMPNGVAFRDGDLYVAEVNRILRYDGIEARLSDPPDPVVINDSYPSDPGHGWKFIAFGPDDKLYVPVGAPCNVCVSDNPIYATITRINPDGSGREIFARGIRNTVGFDWNPSTRELWFTDNGRDNLGDDVPPDELNRAPEPGMDFGFPYCHGGYIRDPQFGDQHDCSEFTPPEMKLGPHVDALGMRFYTGNMFPTEYRSQIFIAEHGSWNRTTPIGYRISLVRLENGHAVSYEVFAEGWLVGGQAWGRPVGLLILPDGSMLVSDDLGGKIYRITYGE
jgi:glucose/arabinose dehydrogenase